MVFQNKLVIVVPKQE